jgi:putative ABC transport system permease protein
MEMLRSLADDVRYSMRSLQRHPAFVAGVVATFALAIGANAAMFGVVHRLMIAPPPGVRDADRVVKLQIAHATEDGATSTMTTTSYPLFRDVATLDRVFRDVAAVRPDTVTTGHGAELSEIAAVHASGSYFSVLQARPRLGRTFGPGDDRAPDGNDVVVLSHAFRQRRFAGASNVIGQTLVVDDRELSIIGVTEPGFNGTELAPTDVFIPLSTAMRGQDAAWWNNPGMRVISIVGRLHEGVTARAAGDVVTPLLRNERARGVLVSLVPGRSARVSPQSRIALWLSGVALVVLLIATANVAILYLLRAAKRRVDDAVRTALGASRVSLVRGVLLESLLLALIGGSAGILLSRWFADVVRVSLLPNLAATDRLIDDRVLLASIAASCLTGLVAGIAPLTSFGRRNVAGDLRAGGHGASRRFLLQRTLVAAQVVLCTTLLIGAGLFVRSLQRVRSQDLGFSTARLLYVTLDFRGALSGLEADLAHEEAVRRLTSLTGVTGATVVQGMPFASHHVPPISIPGYELPPPDVKQLPILYGATPKYLDMMGVTLREGRLFTPRDTRGSPLVALVNEVMARTVWPGENAIGKCVKAGHAPGSLDGDPLQAAVALPCREVVGVVRDSRARSLRLDDDEARLPQYYVPFGQLPAPPFGNHAAVHALLIRTADEPLRLASQVQRLIQGAIGVPVYARARPYQELIDPQLRTWRLGATMFLTFGVLALGIAAVGLTAVMSYLVAQRSREIGVRLALGGTRGTIARLVVWDAVRMAGIGAAIGIALALIAAPLVQAMLFETSAREPATVVTAALVLVGVAIGASAIPAWRASRVDPLEVLRAEH